MRLYEMLAQLPDAGGFNPWRVDGSQDVEVTGLSSTKSATPQDLTLCTAAFFVRHSAEILGTAARCIIAPLSMEADLAGPFRDKTVIYTADTKLMFAYLARPFIEQSMEHTAPEIGRDCLIDYSAKVYNAVIGDRVWIGPDVVIGGQGFGFVIDTTNGRVVKMPQLGRVIIGDDVELCANTTIARGALDDTVIGNQVKVDQNVHIAHGVTIGEGTLVMASAMIAGSTKIGRYCWIGPGTNIINKVTIGDFAMTGIGANVVRDVEPNALVVGNPAKKLRDRFDAGDPMLRL